MNIFSLVLINWMSNLSTLCAFILGAVLIMKAVGLFMLAISYLADDGTFEELPPRLKSHKKAVKIYLCFLMTLFLLNIVLLSKKQMYEIFVIHQITNINNAEKLPDNLVNAANSFLEEYGRNKDKE